MQEAGCRRAKRRRPRRRRGPGRPVRPGPAGPSLRAGSADGPARTHLASSSSGVSGHFAAKLTVTALDAEAVRAPSSESQSAVEPRSSRTTSPAFAMTRARRRKRDPLGPGAHSPQPLSSRRLLPQRGRPLPVEGARVRYSDRGLAWAERMRRALWRCPVSRRGLSPEPRRCGRRRNAERGWLMLRRVHNWDLRFSDRGSGARGQETEVGFWPAKAGWRWRNLEAKARTSVVISHIAQAENKAYQGQIPTSWDSQILLHIRVTW